MVAKNKICKKDVGHKGISVFTVVKIRGSKNFDTTFSNCSAYIQNVNLFIKKFTCNKKFP